jgi:site-specific DNA recombinase
MRLLPAIRLSIRDDASTSLERQMDKIQTYARLGDHELVSISEAEYDLDVSGAVSPWERPGLGPWLTDDRLGMWDAICVAKLDRLTRSLIDFVTLMAWLEARGTSRTRPGSRRHLLGRLKVLARRPVSTAAIDGHLFAHPGRGERS